MISGYFVVFVMIYNNIVMADFGLLQMLIMAGYPVYQDRMILQRKLKLFKTERGLLDWIQEVSTCVFK